MLSPSIRIGISGWRYAPWRGNFYPEGLPQHAELEYAARAFASVEINGSFYSLQSPDSWQAWHDATPQDFVFAVKGARYITHMLRLKDIKTPLANFFASGLFNLREKLGPILWQFPPNFRFDEERLGAFLALLPRDLKEAQILARRRAPFMRGRVALAIGENRPLRYAFEVRHESFDDPRFVALLRQHGAALVVAESAGRFPLLGDVTSDFLYLRLHGDKQLYRSGYSPGALKRWADRIRLWTQGQSPTDVARADGQARPPKRCRDLYCYFDNTDDKLRAPADAATLMRKLGLKWAPAVQEPSRRAAYRAVSGTNQTV